MIKCNCLEMLELGCTRRRANVPVWRCEGETLPVCGCVRGRLHQFGGVREKLYPCGCVRETSVDVLGGDCTSVDV